MKVERGVVVDRIKNEKANAENTLRQDEQHGQGEREIAFDKGRIEGLSEALVIVQSIGG